MDSSPGVVALIRLAAQTENVLFESVRAFRHHVLTFIHARAKNFRHKGMPTTP